MKTYIVIGAGILGASTAYHLARAGAAVTLVDRNDPGQATDAAAGIVCPWLSQRRNKAWYNLAKDGADYYTTLIKELEAVGETDTGYKKVGAISIHTADEKLLKLEERARTKRLDAPEVGEIARLSREKTKALFPPLAEQYRSVYISGAARVNGRALRQALIRAACKYGAAFIQGDAVLNYHQQKIYGITVNGHTLFSDDVIVTAGVWANELVSPLGVNLLITSQKAQIIHLEMPDEATENRPVVMPPNDQYIVSFEDGRIVIGATHENGISLDNVSVTAGGLYEVFHKAFSVAPGLAESTVIETRVGFRPFTPGFLPIIGRLLGYEGLFIANGLGASGLTVGPYLGAELAKLALGNETEININDYDVAGAIK